MSGKTINKYYDTFSQNLVFVILWTKWIHSSFLHTMLTYLIIIIKETKSYKICTHSSTIEKQASEITVIIIGNTTSYNYYYHTIGLVHMFSIHTCYHLRVFAMTAVQSDQAYEF